MKNHQHEYGATGAFDDAAGIGVRRQRMTPARKGENVFFHNLTKGFDALPYR